MPSIIFAADRKRASDGKISAEEAAALTRKYQLMIEGRAKQSVSFTKQYRAYVINYSLGLDMVRADGELQRRVGALERFEQIISEPTLPGDLKAVR